MPSWISRRGVCTPANEEVYIDYSQSKDPRIIKAFKEGKIKSHIHKGPDRAATEVLKQQGVDYLGGDARMDPDMIHRARQAGMTIDEYLKLNDPITPEELAKQKEKEDKVVDHQPEPTKPAVPGAGGGFEDMRP